MGDQGVRHTAFKRIEKFNDDKTEQVWELFREEFARVSVAEDGETGWRVAAGLMSIDEINKSITEEDAANIISDIASSSSATIQVTASWIENKEGKNQLTETGVCTHSERGAVRKRKCHWYRRASRGTLAAPSMRVLSSRSIGAVGAFVNTSAN